MMNSDLALTISWRSPQVLFAAVAGYCSLGMAYESGLMAAIDKVAIKVLIKHVGYIGLGAAMPAFQWYAAWGIRVVACVIAAALYELCLRIVSACYHRWKPSPQKPLPE
jgi:hypothetical protein